MRKAGNLPPTSDTVKAAREAAFTPARHAPRARPAIGRDATVPGVGPTLAFAAGMRPSLRCAATVFVLALPLAACVLAPVEKPTAQVRQVSLGTASYTSLLGELDLDVQNPNGFGLPLSSIEWQLTIGGARAVTGSAELSQTIPAKGAAPIATTLRVDLRQAVDVATALSRGARDYRLDARLHFATRFGDLAVDLQHQGSLASAGGLLGALDDVRW